MSYKIIILAPSAGGKSTLMRYLREKSNLRVLEIDEEIVKANNNTWPDNAKLKKSLIEKITNRVIEENDVIYIAKDIPEVLIRKAKTKGFIIYILKLTLEQLSERNIKRMHDEGYEDMSLWQKDQLKDLDTLASHGIIDGFIDGNATTSEIVAKLIDLTAS